MQAKISKSRGENGAPYLLTAYQSSNNNLFALQLLQHSFNVVVNILLMSPFTRIGMNIMAVLLMQSVLLLLVGGSCAFVQQKTLLHSTTHSIHHLSTTTSSLGALPEFNPFLIADGISAATYMGSESDVFADPAVTGALSTLRTFFVVLTAAAFGLTALAYITAAFIVPKAAEQLENDTKRLRPGLWEEYEARLEDGQTMANRPGE